MRLKDLLFGGGVVIVAIAIAAFFLSSPENAAGQTQPPPPGFSLPIDICAGARTQADCVDCVENTWCEPCAGRPCLDANCMTCEDPIPPGTVHNNCTTAMAFCLGVGGSGNLSESEVADEADRLAVHAQIKNILRYVAPDVQEELLTCVDPCFSPAVLE